MGSSSSTPSYPGSRAQNRPHPPRNSTPSSSEAPNHRRRGGRRTPSNFHPGARSNSLRSPLQTPGQFSSSSTAPSFLRTSTRRNATPRKPGAYSITPHSANTNNSSGTMLRLAVPAGVRPGMEFQVNSGVRTIRVRCPPNVYPGQLLDITIPPEPSVGGPNSMARLTLLASEDDEFNVDLSSVAAAASSSSSSISNSTKDSNKKKTNPPIKSNNDDNDDDDDTTTATTHNKPNEVKHNSPGVTRIPNPDPNGPQAYQVQIPLGITGGQQFVVTIQNQKLAVTCPPNLRSGNFVRVVPPTTSPPLPNMSSSSSFSPSSSSSPSTQRTQRTQSVTGQDGDVSSEDEGIDEERAQRQSLRPQMALQMFEVTIPTGVHAGQPFTLMAGGQRVLVTCPPNTTAGQRIRFQLPMPESHSNTSNGGSTTNNTQSSYHHQNNSRSMDAASYIKLNYDTKDGWTRTIRLSDYHFQWIRTTNQGQIKHNLRFDIDRSAYVRKLEFLKGKDYRMRTGKLSLVQASEAAVPSSVQSFDLPKRDLVTYADISTAQQKNYTEKVIWFQDMCELLRTEWGKGHMRIQVRRDFLLSDSLVSVMSLGRDDLRKTWRFEFLGEEGVDAGGLAREWFQLVTEEIFNPDRGLWWSNEGSQMFMQINASSKLSCGNDHLVYFRFLGRVMGKALFDQRLISGHMVRHVYKHILGWPVTFNDLELVDEQYYQNLKKLTTYEKEELEMLCLDFTYTEQSMGVSKEIELAKNGKSIDVTQENLPEYLEACTKYRLMGRVRTQMTELLLGFFDIIPEPLLTVFDFQELELLMCGLPVIDMEDWKANTEYAGTVKTKGQNHRVVKWFWEVVEEDFDQAMKAKLLQFATGTSGVPSRGFSVLQGNDGDIRKFSIEGVTLVTSLFPRSHTCFNRIDLPMYTKKQDLREKLKLAVEMEPTGFSLE